MQLTHSLIPAPTRSVNRIRRIQGQLDGIEKMIADRRYCPDVLMQTKAVSAAVRALESEILECHLRSCVTKAFESKDSEAIEEKISELVTLFQRKP